MKVEVEYVPEKPDIEDDLLEDFRYIFEKFKFTDAAAGTEVQVKSYLVQIFFSSECCASVN